MVSIRLNWSLPGRAFYPTNVSFVSFVSVFLFLCFSSRCTYLLTHFDCISFSPHYDSFHSLTTNHHLSFAMHKIVVKIAVIYYNLSINYRKFCNLNAVMNNYEEFIFFVISVF